MRKRQNEYYAYRSWACCESECQGYQPLTKKTCAECQQEYEERYDQIQPENIEPIEKCIICKKTLALTFFSSEWEVEEKALFVCGEECKDNYWRIKKQILNWVADKELQEQLNYSLLYRSRSFWQTSLVKTSRVPALRSLTILDSRGDYC